MSQYEHPLFSDQFRANNKYQWQKRWILFKQNSQTYFGNITAFKLYSHGPCLGRFSTHKFHVMIVLQYSYNNSAYRVSVSASLGARSRRQCLVKACVASKQLWCLFCVIWRACCPGSIQGFHTSLTHFSLPGFLLTGHKLSRGRGGLRSEKKDQSGPHFSSGFFIFFLSHILWYKSAERVKIS